MSLKRRLAWTLSLILAGVGITVALAGRYASDLYFQEVNQTLNASLSMYVVDRLTLIEDGTVNEQALHNLADQAMTVNPSVEVYLLDPQGRVVAHTMPPETIRHQQVATAPIEAFIAGATQRPLLGTDPRSLSPKAFSASPILHGDTLQGYLYVVLGGQLFDQVQASFFGTFIGRMGAASLLAVLLLGGVAGLIALRHTTRPLEALQDALSRYTRSAFVDDKAIYAVPENTLEVKELKHQVTHMTRALSAQFEQIETHDRLRRELLANVSHDLRTPLASMQGYLETLLIKDGQLDARERRRYAEIAHQHATRLNTLVGHLFELAKLDSGAISVDLESFPVAELLHDVMQEFELQAREQGIQLSLVGAQAAAGVHAVADISMMQRVFENLLSNALRHTPRGGRIDIEVKPRAECVEVEVKDSGSGIAPDLLPTVFERYASGNAQGESSGLGLAIVKRILELHRSEIHVSSRVQHGTCFSFELDRAA